MEKPEEQDLNDVLSAIREMVRNETRANFAKAEKTEPVSARKPHTQKQTTTLPAKILILQPHMRVYPKTKDVFILDENARIPHDTPIEPNDSFAIADTSVDTDMLRDIVREVVQEQLQGELGREIIGAIKRDMIHLLEKNR